MHNSTHRDIANKEIRPDVYKTVFKMIDPTRERRRNKPPKPDRKWEDGPKKPGEDDDEDDSFVKKTLKKQM